MRLIEFKNYISSFKAGTKFDYGIGEPFSWRGSFDEVAFDFLRETPMTRENILSNIEKAYTETFRGYKGGNYEYDDQTSVHFEHDECCYSDGNYCRKAIAFLDNNKVYLSQEMELIEKAFKK